MRPEKAKRILQKYFDTTDLDRNFDEEICLAFDEAFDALEKETAKEPAVMIDTWICPSCNSGIEYQFLLGDNVLFHGFHDFCPKCGQAIDWEGE